MAGKFTDDEVKFLEEAVQRLEFPSFLVRATHQLGKPIEAGLKQLPAPAKNLVAKASRKAINTAFEAALQTLPAAKGSKTFGEALAASSRGSYIHAAGSAVVGAIGGFFGLPAVFAELPVTTTLLFRSMAEIAGQFGEPMDDPRTRLDCLTLFSMGGESDGDDTVESTYYSARVGMATMLEQSLRFVVGKSVREVLRAVEGKSAPALVALLVKIASRFEIVVGEKALAQLLPGIGAGAGAALNLAFADHYSGLARAHFGLRRLEREHGEDAVRRKYETIRKKLAAQKG